MLITFSEFVFPWKRHQLRELLTKGVCALLCWRILFSITLDSASAFQYLPLSSFLLAHTIRSHIPALLENTGVGRAWKWIVGTGPAWKAEFWPKALGLQNKSSWSWSGPRAVASEVPTLHERLVRKFYSIL